MPDFFIDLPCDVLVAFAQLQGFDPKKQQLIKDIMSYGVFLYDGTFYNVNVDDGTILKYEGEEERLSSDDFDNERIIIGKEALKCVGLSDDWLYQNLDDYIGIPHTVYRPLVFSNSERPLVTGINQMYSNMVYRVNSIVGMGEFINGKKLFAMAQYRAIVSLYDEIIQKLFAELHDDKYSILRSEVISHPISGAIRAVLTNRHDINEDVILVGDTLIKTLFPYLYDKHHGNMADINKELVESNAIILINRPPTISHLSIISGRPRVASVYPYGKIDGTNGCLLHNERYCEEMKDTIGLFKDVEGDVERFSSLIDEDGIDTIGLRVISVNPIVLDGLAGDYDGDVLLNIALYSDAAKAQAERILPSRSFTNYANGTIRNHIVEDLLFDIERSAVFRLG